MARGIPCGSILSPNYSANQRTNNLFISSHLRKSASICGLISEIFKE
jgi:hypothetical protein